MNFLSSETPLKTTNLSPRDRQLMQRRQKVRFASEVVEDGLSFPGKEQPIFHGDPGFQRPRPDEESDEPVPLPDVNPQ